MRCPLSRARLVPSSLLVIAGLAPALLCSGRPVTAQHHPELIQATLLEHLPLDHDDLPPVLCLSVKPAHAEGVRDATQEEIPSELPAHFEVVGGSECSRHRLGARHGSTGREALTVRIGVDGVPATGRAEVTYGWYRHGSNAGAVKCSARRSGAGAEWELGDCVALWES